MPLYYFVLQYLHVIGGTVLLGTGAGIAFFMLKAHLTRDPAVVAGVAELVDALDSKSSSGDRVSVRLRPPAPMDLQRARHVAKPPGSA